MSRAISRKTYEKYASKYKIPFKKKTTSQILARMIYDYEMKNKRIKKGLYII